MRKGANMAEQRVTIRRITRRDFVKGTAAVGVGVTLLGQRGLPTAAHGGRVLNQGNAYNITFIQGVRGDEFYVTMECGIRAKAQELGVNIDVQGPEQFDATLQTPILNAVIQSRPAAILIAPNDAQAMIAPLQAAADAGIAVFCVDTTINSDLQIADISSDNVEGGRLAARSLAEGIGGKGKVFVINVKPGVSTTDQREQGFAEAIKEFPDIQYLGQEYCNNDPIQAAAIASARIQSDPDLAGIFGTNLFSAQGAAAGIREQGKRGQIRVVGFDAGPTQVQDLRTEVVDFLIAQHPGDIGTTALQMAVDYLNTKTEPNPNKVTTGYTAITRENISDPEVARYLYISDCSQYVAPEGTPMMGTPASGAAATPTS